MARLDRDVSLTGAQNQAYDEMLTPDAVNFVANLARRFQPGLEQLLAKRVKVQAAFDSGSQKLDFNPHTQDIRDKDWKVSNVNFSLVCSITSNHLQEDHRIMELRFLADQVTS